VNPYVAVLISFGLCALVATIMVLASRILGQRKTTPIKLEPFECGNPPTGPVFGTRFPVKFYLTAILFIVFDVEVVFLYPWAIVFRRLGWPGLFEMAAFVLILAVGLAYVWRKGALEWE